MGSHSRYTTNGNFLSVPSLPPGSPSFHINWETWVFHNGGQLIFLLPGSLQALPLAHLASTMMYEIKDSKEVFHVFYQIPHQLNTQLNSRDTAVSHPAFSLLILAFTI